MDKTHKQQIKQAQDWNGLIAILLSLKEKDFNSREIELIARNIERVRTTSDVKIAFLANHTLDLLPNYLSVLAALDNLKIQSYVAPYNQYFQEFLLQTSGLLQFDADIIYLDLSIVNLSPEINYHFLQLNNEQKEQELNRIADLLQQLASKAKQNTNATLLMSNFVQPSYPQAGVADFQLEFSEVEWYSRLNLRLIELFRSETRVFIVDKNNVLSRLGKSASSNTKMYYMAKMELNEQALFELSTELIRYIKAVKGLTKKCLVLDLDNTLWGGVVGEDGIDSLKIGKGYPEGELFYDLQMHYQSLKQRGVILAIASKNNVEDAEQMFKEKQDMPLNSDDFAIRKISWDAKHQSIEEIANMLNIGRDSIVFIDDNPIERELIRSTMPEVAVPDLPKDPSGYLNVIEQFNYFEKLFLTEEDVTKLEQYKQNAQRQELKKNVSDINQFLSNLSTVLSIKTAEIKQIPRVHQLFTKTNQFNVTTHRYDTKTIEQFITHERWELLLFSVADNFGDMGIIGLVLLEHESKGVYIDSFILSCRAMGRSIETAVMNTLKQRYLLTGNKSMMTAKYIKTQKNKPVENFFEQQGFSVHGIANENEKNYRILQANTELLTCPEMQMIVGDE
jgi:FkbH-like protein